MFSYCVHTQTSLAFGWFRGEWAGLDKKTHLSKETDSLSSGFVGYNIPYDDDRKEKSKMVHNWKVEEGWTGPTIQSQLGVNVDADAATSILHAATRGIKNPNFGILSSTSINGDKSERKGDHNGPVPVAKDIAKTAALEAANEADSTEAHSTKE